MSRLPRSTFALLLSLLPASATIIGIVVLAQIPGLTDLAGIALVVIGVALHKPAPQARASASTGTAENRVGCSLE